ncbi:MAG: 50S ribosomal protein L6 [Aphanocapsa feldmannii 277cV]|uniref:Large ribosomal subunit protein uL6 n=2 Tax=Aphanocapsa feldmannii TaxID=192050 RepID=A0A524RMR5_9CHRO|nr:MAG: 50S ribosomal protein L6 [Aphanocapsa feldmannii 288cV]TGG91930.1 MAG: 50S ribosomal protein L6 [Aphanocapsa feldmannii 277cV]TGH28113.1 MAG: 50S ribosomal protein L6 [Aphanocapsa feldmannii 277cI]
MSRIGKQPVPIPAQVDVSIDGMTVKVKGPRGELTRTLPEGVILGLKDNAVVVTRANESRNARMRHGLCRSLVANMIEGVCNGYSKKLEMVGVGYRAQVKASTLVISAGYSHPVELEAPEGITFAVEANTRITVRGYDKEAVGNEAAKIRAVRPPEPYKGKGIRYEGERILRKAGKTGKK